MGANDGDGSWAEIKAAEIVSDFVKGMLEPYRTGMVWEIKEDPDGLVLYSVVKLDDDKVMIQAEETMLFGEERDDGLRAAKLAAKELERLGLKTGVIPSC